MNYLGHIYLSGNNAQKMVGNFIGDYVKGKQYLQYQTEIQEGILLHRAIDHFTDQNRNWKNTRERIYPLYKRYAGVVSDLFFDHFLAVNWNRYHTTPLPGFTSYFHEILWQHYSILPNRVKGFLPFLIQHQRLLSYAKLSGIEESLKIMTSRHSLPDHGAEAIELLNENYNEFEADFTLFMKGVLNHFQIEIPVNALHR